MKRNLDSYQRRGIYLLPNLFTTAGLFAAFYSIMAGMKGDFESSAQFIFIAMVMDTLDGRVARLTNTQSAFGIEYDSLSDMVAFGVAPALVTYSWILNGLGKIGWLISFVFTASVALRLARFNVQAGVVDKRYFQGLPCPAGAGVLASMVWLGDAIFNDYMLFVILVALLTVAVSALMVSNVRYYSFKGLDLKGRVPFMVILIVVLIYVAVSIAPAWVLFFSFLGYFLSGPAITLFRLQKVKATPKKKLSKQQNKS